MLDDPTTHSYDDTVADIAARLADVPTPALPQRIEGWLVEDQRDDIHKRFVRNPVTDQTVCVCGLIVPTQQGLITSAGHREMRGWRPAGVVVLRSPYPRDGGDRRGDLSAHCQRCGWRAPLEWPPERPDDIHSIVPPHDCA